MIPLKKLITIAPFSPEMQQKLLQDLASMPEEQKIKLTDLSWKLIVEECNMKVRFAQEDALYKMGFGEAEYTAEDFQKIEDDIYTELAKKVQILSEEGSLEDVREKLATIKDKMNNSTQKAN